MTSRLIFSFLLLFACACTGNQSPQTTIEEQYPNRLYFQIDSVTLQIVVSVPMNDTVVGRLLFDTDYWPEMVLDSSFFFAHRLMADMSPTELKRCLPVMQQYDIASIRYDTMQSIMIGRTPVNYPCIDVMPVKIYDKNIDGFFNIPKIDTTHVWEINFKESYLEVHPADTFRMPEGSIVLPLLEQEKSYAPGYCIQIPLQIAVGNDTLKSDCLYRIDTGMFFEMLLAYPNKEVDYLYARPEEAWYTGNRTHKRRGLHLVTATAWDHIVMDTLALSSALNRYIANHRYVGVPFLRRFNVFFDMQRQLIGLLPIQHNYARNTLLGLYFCVDTTPTENGAYKINFMRENDNHYQAAGLSLDDEIVAVNNIPYESIARRKVFVGDIVSQTDTLVFDIFRNGQPTQIMVSIPKNKSMKK
jgi:hypothetical protein